MLASLPNPDGASEAQKGLSETRKKKKRWKAKEWQPSDSGTVLFSLGPIGDRDRSSENFLKRVSLLTTQQKETVRRYIAYMKEHDDYEHDDYEPDEFVAFAPEGYWGV